MRVWAADLGPVIISVYAIRVSSDKHHKGRRPSKGNILSQTTVLKCLRRMD